MKQQPQASSSFGENEVIRQGLTSSAEVGLAFIERFWNEGDASCIATCLTDNYVDHAYEPGNAEGLLAMAERLRTAFPDQRSTVESVTVEGDRVVVRLRMKGTHLGTFRGMEATGLPIDARLYREYRIADGRIAEHWALFDTASLLRQIGAELNEQPACRIPGAGALAQA
ncbi:ester cyclase [Cohnella rhizosphaerae]|uniref:Ester cyclase n=1 Tax=Cohnella rhizosphaerae TaxID=1457232 RepID=A0A9X4QUJ8_9BACL|nr:ester cyclase [Cohnella rhizosphaerae]MDG0811574.1 ester cyclase [Cohnella rhizosphaerae]